MKNTKRNTRNRKANNRKAAPAPEFKLETMTRNPITVGDETIMANCRKGDVTVGAWTTHLVEETRKLKVGKACHFAGQSRASVTNQLREAGMKVEYQESNQWKVTDGNNVYVLLNWTPLKAVRAGRSNYERSVRRVKAA